MLIAPLTCHPLVCPGALQEIRQGAGVVPAVAGTGRGQAGQAGARCFPEEADREAAARAAADQERRLEEVS